MKYMIYDAETENHKAYKRVANQFIDDNWVVMRGWKFQGDKQCSYSHHPEKDGSYLHIPDDVTMLVGHNIKFDILFEGDNPSLKAFFKRGGRIWCTQYAEYLINAQHPNSQMNSMDGIIESYGGRKKIDAVKALWEMGTLTSAIDPEMLKDYLIGTEEEGRNSGDIGNTEKIFLGQVKKAKDFNMTKMILARMDGLCATIEMEKNGLFIDREEGKRRQAILEQELEEAVSVLDKYIPELPDGLEFNWASRVHVSCLIFGGTIRYKKSDTYIDEKTGELARLKAKESWPLFEGTPINIQQCSLHENGLYETDCGCIPSQEGYPCEDCCPDGMIFQDVYVSGKRKGDGKFKKVDVQGELKTKIQDFFFKVKGHTEPKPEWQGKTTDGNGDALYQTNADVIDELGCRDIPFLKMLSARQNLTKDLGTYYMRYDPRKKDYVGMLTCVMDDGIIHHSLNHTSTITSRLSSSNPNLQNVPRGDKSEVKKMFTSRFDDGYMLEIDYSQLEVVVQGVLSGDKNLCDDLNKGIDFHCKRVAYKLSCTYEEAIQKCKVEEDPDWKFQRTKCKEFSFQRAYGAGAPAIALTTGMSIDEVKGLIEAEEKMYPGVADFNKRVQDEVSRSAKGFYDPTLEKSYRRGYYVAPTGTRYTFRSYDPPAWKRDQVDTFMPTELKNYPVQGTGGEIVQIILGKLWRHLVSNNNYDGQLLMCNTVHDCVWFDVRKPVAKIAAKEISDIMESVPQVLKELYNMKVTVPFPVEAEIGKDLYTTKVLHL